MKTQKFLALCGAGFALAVILATSNIGGWLAKKASQTTSAPLLIVEEREENDAVRMTFAPRFTVDTNQNQN